MTTPPAEIPDETPNPNTAEQEQCQQQQPPPPQSPHADPQSPKSLTLPDPDPQSPSPSPNQDQNQDSAVQDPISTLTVDDAEPDAPATAACGGGPRRASKRKKLGAKRTALERKSREKLQVLVDTLNPIPFKPAKALDFEKHQGLLQRLGLWDFVHLEFDSLPLRCDLLAQLIASYVSNSRCSYVNGVRINVNRADLGRALKLPKKTGGAGTAPAGDSIDLGESVAFVEELVCNWMLLHDDAYIMPNDVFQCLSLIKEGSFEKVDWQGLIWNMVEKELKAPQLVSCYYASHLQHLIKVQHEELLQEGVEVVEEENEVKEEGEEDEEEEEEVVREEVDGSGDVKMGEVDEVQVHEMEEHKIELSLGQDNNVERVEVEKEQGGEEQMMDFEQSKEEEPGMWLLHQKNCGGESFLRPCHGGDVKGVECEQVKEDEGEDVQEQEEEEEEEEDGEEDEHEGGFHLSPKCLPLEGMTSGNGSLIQVMEAGQMPFGSGIDLRDNSVGDFLSSRDDHMISGSSLFGNGGHKRDNLGLDNHNSHHSLNGSNKRLRSDSPWNSKQMDFETCIEQVEHWMGKARMMYATKDQACEQSTMNQQLLLDELQKRDNMIDHLHKAKMEEAQKRQMEVYRFEKELYMMQSLVDGYRKALKETWKAFAEYRARCPQGDEPLYKDVPGSGGLVLSVMELEKERLKKEAEERAKLRDFMTDFEKKSTDFESTWFGKFQSHMSSVESLSKRLLVMEDQVKHLNEVNAKRKVSDPTECAPTTDGETIECAPTTEGETIGCAPTTEGETIGCAPTTEGETIECAPTIEGETIGCAPTTEGETIECAPTTEGETAQ
ncbi:MICAL protein 2 [Spatholobus suberectus]|nr:MICAL protein 2 [Spatholobus suberectus]